MKSSDAAAMTTETVESIAGFLDQDIALRVPWDILRDAILQLAVSQTFIGRSRDGVEMADIKDELLEYLEYVCDEMIDTMTPPNGRTN